MFQGRLLNENSLRVWLSNEVGLDIHKLPLRQLCRGWLCLARVFFQASLTLAGIPRA